MSHRRGWLRLALGVAVAATIALAQAEERVSFPSLDGEARAPLVLTALWFAAATSPAPAVALLHGCGGIYDRRGELNKRMRDYAALFNGAGYHVLVVDSLTPRYETELCTQRTGKRRVTQANRRLDALGAVAYLADRPDVDAKRIGIVGWSNGGSTVLAATNLRHPDVAAALTKTAFAVAFYPGCEAELKRGYVPAGPLLMLVGQADDWTPAAPCRALARAAAVPKPEIEVFAGAYHDFDGDAPLRLRKDVPNGVNPGQGVHVGGNAAARRAARARLLKFLAAH
jgi:dienelactone hydrolase